MEAAADDALPPPVAGELVLYIAELGAVFLYQAWLSKDNEVDQFT